MNPTSTSDKSILVVGLELAGCANMRIELYRGTAAVKVSWPIAAAGGCSARMRELLR